MAVHLNMVAAYYCDLIYVYCLVFLILLLFLHIALFNLFLFVIPEIVFGYLILVCLFAFVSVRCCVVDVFEQLGCVGCVLCLFFFVFVCCFLLLVLFLLICVFIQF